VRKRAPRIRRPPLWGPRLPPPLSLTLRRVGRLPGQFAPVLLLLCFTAGLGTYSAAAARTHDQNLAATVRYQVGAPVRLVESSPCSVASVAPPMCTADGVGGPAPRALPPFRLNLRAPGVRSATELVEQPKSVAPGAGGASTVGYASANVSATLVLVDTGTFAATAWWPAGIDPLPESRYLQLLHSRPDAVLVSPGLPGTRGRARGRHPGPIPCRPDPGPARPRRPPPDPGGRHPGPTPAAARECGASLAAPRSGRRIPSAPAPGGCLRLRPAVRMAARRAAPARRRCPRQRRSFGAGERQRGGQPGHPRVPLPGSVPASRTAAGRFVPRRHGSVSGTARHMAGRRGLPFRDHAGCAHQPARPGSARRSRRTDQGGPERMAEPVRIGVVGAGSIALRGILPHLTQTDVRDRVRVQAVCDPVPGRAQAAAERFGIPHAFDRFEDLLARGEVDAVTLASPIGLHFQQGRAALAAGKHVHFNKTMTTTVAEATELIDLAHARGLRLVASPGQVLRPQVRAIRALIADGAIGTACWAVTGAAFGTYHEREGVRQGDDVLSNVDPSWYFRRPGGGPLYDMTVYGLHDLTSVLGPARRVTAMSGVRIHEREFRGRMVPCDADDNTLMLLDYGDGLFAFVYGTAAGGVGPTSFFGTKGNISGTRLNGGPIDYPGREVVEGAPDGRGASWTLPHVVGPHRGMEEAHVFEDIMQLVDWIADGTPTPVTAEHARHVVDIIESAFRSAATGTAQELRTTF